MSGTDGRYSAPIPDSVGIQFDKGEWTDLTISALRQLWDLEYSSIRIGQYLGFTKNAIVGKVHRLELTPRVSPIIRDPSLTLSARIRRIEGATLPPLPSEPDRSWITEERKEILCNLWPSPTPTSRIIELLARAFGPALPTPHTISTYCNTQLHLRRPHRTTPAPPDPNAAPPAPRPKTQPRAIVTGGHGQQRRGQIWAALAHRAVTPYTPPVVPKYGRVIECRWPIGEPGKTGFRSCDVPSAPGRPYCEAHVKIAYVRVRDRREDVAQVGDLA
jgi:GcrA cell cycle regulator